MKLKADVYKILLIVIAIFSIIFSIYQFHKWSKSCGADELELTNYRETTKKLVKDVGIIKDVLGDFLKDEKTITKKKKLKGGWIR